jgi:DNA-binding transcriptional LysR family regulator
MPLPASFPDLVSLDLFVSVVVLGSVSRAAAAHGMTQPSASARIAGLERHLGVTLLHRTPGGSVPTTDGALTADWAVRLLAVAAELDAGVRALQPRRGRRLRVAATATVAAWHLPAWLAGGPTGAPVSLQRASAAAVVAGVRAGRADLGFVEGPGGVSGLASAAVGSDRLIVVVTPGHPWARRRGPLPAATLAATPVVVRAATGPDGGSAVGPAVSILLRRAGHVVVAPAAEVASDREVSDAVEAAAGPGIVPQLAVAAEVAAGRLVPVEVEGVVLELRLRAVWAPPGPPPGPAGELLALARRTP